MIIVEGFGGISHEHKVETDGTDNTLMDAWEEYHVIHRLTNRLMNTYLSHTCHLDGHTLGSVHVWRIYHNGSHVQGESETYKDLVYKINFLESFYIF